MTIKYHGALNGGLSDDGETITVARYLVYHFNAGESAVSIRADSNVPALGSGHPDDATLTLKSISVSDPQEGDAAKSGKYIVTLTYSRTAYTYSREEDPWDRPAYDFSILPSEQVIAFQKAYQDGDVNGVPTLPVLNPAGDPYEDSTVQLFTTLKFSYNVRDFDQQTILDFKGTVNDSEIVVCGQTVPEFRGKMKNLSASFQTEYTSGGTGLEYYRIDVEIEIANKPWKRELLCQGLFALYENDLTLKYRIYIDTDGNIGRRDVLDETKNPVPVDTPQRLNLDGTLYTADMTGAVYQEFFDAFALDWTPLLMPTREPTA